VTAIIDGQRYVIRTEATSVFQAAINFGTMVRCLYPSTAGYPEPGDGTVYEVRIVGGERVYRVRHERVWQWANAKAERMNRKR
jgi:hypothetical protein